MKIFVLVLLLGLPAWVGATASADETARPKVGLALAGGGAKGGAHVGILKVLEENNIPVDFIAGTSMGSIIGGLYASGVSADELDQKLRELDWADLLRDTPPRQDLSFRRKEDDARYLLGVELGLKGRRLVWPTGLISGQELFFVLQSLTLPVAGVEDFDELPIPFRAVATDVNTGKKVVLDHGNIATAMRASMAIPSVFSAVEIDGKLLVDGGLSDNVPVDVVRSMGADIVIAVDLGAPLSDFEVGSFLQIYQQTMRMLTRVNMEPQLANADLVLVPEVSRYGTLEFDALDDIIRKGLEEGEARKPEFIDLALSPDSYAEHLARRSVNRRPDPTVDFVRFEGNERVPDQIIQNQLRLTTGQRLDLSQLSSDLGRVFGLGDFKSVDFYIEQDDERGTGVVIRTEEKPWGPNYLNFGFFLETDLDGDTELGLLTNFTATRLNTWGAEWRNDLLVGGDTGIYSEYYQPLGFAGRWFVAPSLEVRRDHLPFYEEGQEVAELDVKRSELSLSIGYEFDVGAEVRIGLNRGSASAKVESGELPRDVINEVDLDDIDYGGIEFGFRTDRLDRVPFPLRGSRMGFDAFFSDEALGADDSYNRLELSMALIRSFGKNIFLGSLDGGASPGGDLPEYDVFRLGGLLSFSGFAEGELRGQYFGVARLGYYRNVFSKYYAGGWFEGGNVWDDSEDIGSDTLIYTTTIFIGRETIVGPIYLAYGQAERGKNKVYLSMGKTF